MAIDYRIGSKVIKNLRREEAAATRVDPYPYIGIVKNNLDPTRSGRLQVWIPDLGGDPDVETGWRTVSYASPFMGYTPRKESNQNPSTLNRFEDVPNTYGMWMVPPDIGVEVLVIFVAGDPNRGYWIACVNSNLSHYMLPGLAGSNNVDDLPAKSSIERALIDAGIKMPVAEFNEYAPNSQNSNYYKNPKPLHTWQFENLLRQGLHLDNIRGSISSSSQRETPSQVFGISTPGRPDGSTDSKDPAKDPTFKNKVRDGSLTEDYYAVKSRKGGHTFVMDDGDVLGRDQLVRLRTSNGHQIMMHDTEDTLYISHASGDTWVELTKFGTVNVYAKKGFALRSDGDINLHSDANIVMNAAKNIIFRAENKIQQETSEHTILTNKLSVTANALAEFKAGAYNIESDRNVSIGAGQNIILKSGVGISENTLPAAPVKAVAPLKLQSLPDTVFDSTLGVWVNKPSMLSTVVKVAPSHEPYYRGTSTPTAAAPFADQLPSTYQGTNDPIKSLPPTKLSLSPDAALRNQPKAKALGPLTEEEIRALMAAIGHRESTSNYQAHNGLGYYGKYQFGAEALQGLGYIRKDLVTRYSKLGAEGHIALMNNPNSWTGKDGINSLDDYLANQQAQEDIMYQLLQSNYNTLKASGMITADMTHGDIGGLITAAHLKGAGNTIAWRKNQLDKTTDGFGTDIGTYFDLGRGAIEVSAKKIPGLDAG